MSRRFKLNTILIILEIIGFVITWFVNGWVLFTYYTQDSNFLFLLTLICYEIWMIKNPDHENKIMPRWIYMLKYVSTGMLIVTFVVVVCILAPMGFTESVPFGLQLLFGNANLFQHILCPLIGAFAFVKIDSFESISLKNNFAAMIPTIVYSFVTLWANIEGIMYGPYPFLHVYEQTVLATGLWVLAIWATAFAFAFLLRWLAVKFHGLR